MRVYTIAEIGPNHNGSLDMALKYIERLSRSDVDAIKFQLGDPEEIFSDDSFKAKYQKKNKPNESPKEMSKSHQLKPSDHIILSKACKKNNIDYFCSAFDLKSLIYLD